MEEALGEQPTCLGGLTYLTCTGSPAINSAADPALPVAFAKYPDL